MITPSQILTPVLAALDAAWGPQSAAPQKARVSVAATLRHALEGLFDSPAGSTSSSLRAMRLRPPIPWPATSSMPFKSSTPPSPSPSPTSSLQRPSPCRRSMRASAAQDKKLNDKGKIALLMKAVFGVEE